MKYFDYAATTPIDRNVYNTYQRVGEECFFNSGCNQKAKDLETNTRLSILNNLGLSDNKHELIFTSGGTEANNLAILGFAKTLSTKKHFITSCFEHASVDTCFKQLELEGHEVSYINVDNNGHVNVEDVFKAIKPETVLISIMSVNNELGSRQPIEQMFAYIKKNHPHIITMSDYVQGLGKIKLDFTNIDLLTISSHKIYGPKGVGALIKTHSTPIKPLIYGGTNEYGLRAGLQSLPAQVAFAQAVKNIIEKFDEHLAKINEARDLFLDLVNKSDVLNLNCPTEANVASIRLNSTEENTEILKLMEKRGFYLSARSADSAGLKLYSRSLLGIGLNKYDIDRTMRVSFSHLTSKNDVKSLVNNLEEVIENH